MCAYASDKAITEFLNGYFSTHERSRKTWGRACAGAVFACLEAAENGSAQGVLLLLGQARRINGITVLASTPQLWPGGPLPRALTETEIKELLAPGRTRSASGGYFPKTMQVSARLSIGFASREYRVVRNLALVDLLFATGMRVGEGSTLNVQDFTPSESVLRIKGKGGRDRLAYLVDEQTVHIQLKHFEKRSQIVTSSPALFLNSTGERLSTQSMANIIGRCRQAAGIDRHITPHMLRHTVATLLLRNGMDIRVVQEFLGYASIATTQRYTHIVKEHLIGELRKGIPHCHCGC